MIDMIERIHNRSFTEITLGKEQVKQTGSDFKALLQQKIDLSKHAAEQLSYRDISGDGQTVQRLEQALDTLSQKGVRQSLVMLDNTAYLMDVAARKVITAMQAADMKNKVFTNIDGAIIA